MNPLGTKLLASVGAVGVLGGGGYGIYALTNISDSVIKYLEESKFKITTKEDVATWEKALKTYRLEKVGFEIDGEVNTPEDIQKWCEKNLTKKINSTNDPLFQKTSKWCVNYTTIKEQLGKTAKLEEKAETLNSKHNTFPKRMQDEIKEITLSGTGQTHVNGLKTVEWCKKNVDRSYSNDSEFYFENIKKYCLAAAAAA